MDIPRNIQEYERTGVVPPRPTPEKIKETMLRHAKLQIEFKGDFIGIREMRKHVAWYNKRNERFCKTQGCDQSGGIL